MVRLTDCFIALLQLLGPQFGPQNEDQTPRFKQNKEDSHDDEDPY